MKVKGLKIPRHLLQMLANGNLQSFSIAHRKLIAPKDYLTTIRKNGGFSYRGFYYALYINQSDQWQTKSLRRQTGSPETLIDQNSSLGCKDIC
jgi:hypothetical protein